MVLMPDDDLPPWALPLDELWADFASAQSKRAASQILLDLTEQEEPEPAQLLPVTIH